MMIFGVYLLILRRAVPRLPAKRTAGKRRASPLPAKRTAGKSGAPPRERGYGHPALREYRVGIIPNFKEKSREKQGAGVGGQGEE